MNDLSYYWPLGLDASQVHHTYLLQWVCGWVDYNHIMPPAWPWYIQINTLNPHVIKYTIWFVKIYELYNQRVPIKNGGRCAWCYWLSQNISHVISPRWNASNVVFNYDKWFYNWGEYITFEHINVDSLFCWRSLLMDYNRWRLSLS